MVERQDLFGEQEEGRFEESAGGGLCPLGVSFSIGRSTAITRQWLKVAISEGSFL